MTTKTPTPTQKATPVRTQTLRASIALQQQARSLTIHHRHHRHNQSHGICSKCKRKSGSIKRMTICNHTKFYPTLLLSSSTYAIIIAVKHSMLGLQSKTSSYTSILLMLRMSWIPSWPLTVKIFTQTKLNRNSGFQWKLTTATCDFLLVACQKHLLLDSERKKRIIHHRIEIVHMQTDLVFLCCEHPVGGTHSRADFRYA